MRKRCVKLARFATPLGVYYLLEWLARAFREDEEGNFQKSVRETMR